MNDDEEGRYRFSDNPLTSEDANDIKRRDPSSEEYLRGQVPSYLLHVEGQTRNVKQLSGHVATLRDARKYLLDFKVWGEDTALNWFLNWQNTRVALKVERWRFANGSISRKRYYWRVPRRGDDLYKYNLKSKLDWLDRLSSEGDFNPNARGFQDTNFVFITWTTDNKKYGFSPSDKANCWCEDSESVNRCLTRLRQHYGRVEYIRSNEGTLNGFPAPHGVLLFLDKKWRVYRHKDKDGRYRWRLIPSQRNELKDILEGKDTRSKPVLGFVDIQGVYNPRLALKHILKYSFGTKDDFPEEERVRKLEIQELTYFWLCITRKHTYTMSHHFVESVFSHLDLKLDLHRISKDKHCLWVIFGVDYMYDAEKWAGEEIDLVDWWEKPVVEPVLDRKALREGWAVFKSVADRIEVEIEEKARRDVDPFVGEWN